MRSTGKLGMGRNWRGFVDLISSYKKFKIIKK